MARFGEGDSRWIVEDRADGANVHNWHWAETDCIDWSRSRLSSLLSDLLILHDDHLLIKTVKVDKIQGEAYVNVRKGKIIPGYELNLSISWMGEALTSDCTSPLKVDGAVEIPYLSDENADEDPELRVTVKDDGPLGRRMRDAFIAKGKPLVLEKIRVYVREMSTGGPTKGDLEVKKPPSGDGRSNAHHSSAKKPAVVGNGGGGQAGKKGFRTITITERFRCRAWDLYEILMDENRWKGFTKSNARISRVVGGEIAIFDGSVKGSNVELIQGKLIVQHWTFGSWPDGTISTVRLSLDEADGITMVNLVHSGVPEEDRYGNATVVENTERGWRMHIFEQIKNAFSFGI